MTIAETSAPGTFALDASDTALDALGDRLYGAVGACDGRLAKAVAMVRSGAVTVVSPGYAIVQSQTDHAVSYHVNPSCTCNDAIHRAEQGRCKHKLAAALAHRLAMPVAPVSPKAAPLYEAPASLNCHVMIAGRQVQLTVRSHDASALLAELERLLQRFPVEAPAPNIPAAPHGADWCSGHATQMPRHTKEGRSWYAHKTADGTWCRGKNT